MSDLVLTEQEQDLVERIGVLHDGLGFSPAPGRIVGLLLVSPRPALTFDEIRATLGLSKSSTSVGLNLLLGIGSVEYLTRPGERRRYFRKSYRNWEAALLQRMDAFLSLSELLREVHGLHRGNPDRSGPEIPRMVDFLEFLQQTLHDANRRWTADQATDETGTPSGSRRHDAEAAGETAGAPEQEEE